ncbi:MAG: hypothetical protein RLZZ338_1175 [Cyanobacteriota bacterium]|jgi:hypothetical protein
MSLIGKNFDGLFEHNRAMITWTLMLGSLGIDALLLSRWIYYEQFKITKEIEEEEEMLTPYESHEDNSSSVNSTATNGSTKVTTNDSNLMGWEFKIVRASSDLFRNPAIFHRLCQEEAESGWILLEKLDDRRVRFKRPIAMRDILQSEIPPIDPYRSQYGPNGNWILWVSSAVFLMAMILPAFLGYALVSSSLKQSNSSPSILAPSSESNPSSAPGSN